MFEELCKNLELYGSLQRVMKSPQHTTWLFLCPEFNTSELPPKAVGLILVNQKALDVNETIVSLGLVKYPRTVPREKVLRTFSPYYLGVCTDERGAIAFLNLPHKVNVSAPLFLGEYITRRVERLEELEPENERNEDSILREEMTVINSFFDSSDSKKEFYDLHPELALKWSEYIDLVLEEKSSRRNSRRR
jgi:hypothetical protein